MAKDLRTLTTQKLWVRARAALEEIERRSLNEQTASLRTEPRHEPEPNPGTIEATMQRRLTRPHLPKPDPAYLAAFERTRARAPAPQAPIDTEGMTAPGPSEPAE